MQKIEILITFPETEKKTVYHIITILHLFNLVHDENDFKLQLKG